MDKSSSADSSYVRCSSCGKHVFIGTRRCPQCGHLMRWNLKPLFFWLVAVMIGAMLSYALVQWLEVDDAPRIDPEAATPYNS